MELIKQWIEYREQNNIQNEFLFLSKYKNEWNNVEAGTLKTSWIKKIGKIINTPELHCHDMRHSGSNLLFHSGVRECE